MRSNDRILVLEKIDPKAGNGLFDPDVFTGKNNLHVVMDPQTTMWHFKYERGTIPPPLRFKFTDFNSALKIAEQYFVTKNIRIVEVLD